MSTLYEEVKEAQRKTAANRKLNEGRLNDWSRGELEDYIEILLDQADRIRHYYESAVVSKEFDTACERLVEASMWIKQGLSKIKEWDHTYE